MKIAVISDTHNNLATAEKALAWIKEKEIKEIIHCGDLTDPDTLDFFLKNFPGLINISRGNADNPIIASTGQSVIWEEYGEIVAARKKIAFTHFPEKAIELAKKNQFDVVFYGHTHKPWSKTVGSCLLANPGNLAGLFYKPTFAVYDTSQGSLELKILENLI